MRSLKKVCLFFCLFILSCSQTVVAFDLDDEDAIYKYFNTYKKKDFIFLEVIHEPIFFSTGDEGKVALLPLEISVGERKYFQHQPKYFLVFTKHQKNIWIPIGSPTKKKRILYLFGKNAEMAFFKAGY